MMYIKKYLLEKLAFLKWSREYDGHTALSDVVGGVTIGLTLIPQVIAYAAMAGLEPQYGLYASIWGGIIYLFLGTIPEVSVAPTAILSLLTNDYIKDVSFDRAKAAVLMCFLSGCIQLVCGIFHLELDLIPLFATFISCLIFGLEFGILIGILVDLIKFLVVSSMPLISVETENINLDKSYITINLILPMHYFSIEHVRAKILKEMIVKGENYQNVALDFSRIVKIDYTTALVIQNLVRDLNKNGKQVILVKVNEQISKQIEFVCGEKCNIFPTYQDVKNYLVDMKNNQRETRVEI